MGAREVSGIMCKALGSTLRTLKENKAVTTLPLQTDMYGWLFISSTSNIFEFLKQGLLSVTHVSLELSM